MESFLTTFDPKLAEIDPKATIRRPNGNRTRFTRDDMNVVLEAVARKPDGSYRVVAGRQLPGKILGGFQYSGTRPDDPNDVVPHEHRRELRALRVFGAWTNLTDLKAANTLDTVLPENGRSIVKHILQDVGSTFGMCNDIYEWDLSWEHFYQGEPSCQAIVLVRIRAEPMADSEYEYPRSASSRETYSIRESGGRSRRRRPTWSCETMTPSGQRVGSSHSRTT